MTPRLSVGSLRLVKRALRHISLLLLALWLPATLHCDLEAAGLIPPILSCQDQHAPDTHAGDSCALVENGHYHGAIALLKAPAPSLLACTLCCVALLTPPPVAVPLVSPERTDSPPELIRVWQFDRRAALPSRAPTLLG